MNVRSWLFLGAALLGATAAATIPATEAFAKTKPESFKAKFGKKGFKDNLPNTPTASYQTSLGTLIIAANSVKGVKVAFVTMSTAGVPNPTTATFPVTLSGANSTYSTGSAFGSPQGWVGAGTTTIVLTGYDAATQRLSGTVSGTMEPGNNTPAGTITISKASFSIALMIN